MNRRDLETRLQGFFDGALEEEEFRALERQLRVDPDARECYRDYLHLHHLLGYRAEAIEPALEQPVAPAAAPIRLTRFPKKRATLAAIAATVAAMIGGGLAWYQAARPPLRFTTSPGTNISVTNEFVPVGRSGVGSGIEPGSRLEVGNGTMELNFASGVRGIVRGPASLTLYRKDLLQLERGTAWFQVPAGTGFKVSTPDLILNNASAEFGVISDPAFPSEVHVFTGTTEALNRRGIQSTRWVAAGQAGAARDSGEWQDIPVRRNRFATSLPAVEPESNLIVTKEVSTVPLAYAREVSTDDLLSGIIPTTTGWNRDNDASPLKLTDGIYGGRFEQVPGDKVQGAWTTVGATAEYQLGKGPNGNGYNLTMVRSFADWENVGFGNQAWTMEVKPVGGDWSPLASIIYEPLEAQPLTGGGGATKVTITGKDGRLARGIEAIKITAGRVPGSVKNAFVWRELDVFGAPTEATPQSSPPHSAPATF